MKNALTITEISVYTDGSCNTQKRIGAWVAILLYEPKKIILRGMESNTTHNRMELTAVIKAAEYVFENIKNVQMHIFTDSQYVMSLPSRSGKLLADNFITKAGKKNQNADLLKKIFTLFESNCIHLNKVRAHQRKDETINYNIMADKISRSLTRATVNKDRFLPNQNKFL